MCDCVNKFKDCHTDSIPRIQRYGRLHLQLTRTGAVLPYHCTRLDTIRGKSRKCLYHIPLFRIEYILLGRSRSGFGVGVGVDILRPESESESGLRKIRRLRSPASPPPPVPTPMGERVVCFASCSLIPAQRRYSVTEREALSCVWAVEKLRKYLWGRPFNLQVDHAALMTLMTSPGVGRARLRIARLASRLMA